MATVLIMGASKGIGLETVKCALKAGHTVRAMARSAVRLPVRHANLETVTGDALDAKAVTRALAGVDVVIQTLGVTAGPDFLFKPVRLFRCDPRPRRGDGGDGGPAIDLRHRFRRR